MDNELKEYLIKLAIRASVMSLSGVTAFIIQCQAGKLIDKKFPGNDEKTIRTRKLCKIVFNNTVGAAFGLGGNWSATKIGDIVTEALNKATTEEGE